LKPYGAHTGIAPWSDARGNAHKRSGVTSGVWAATIKVRTLRRWGGEEQKAKLNSLTLSR